ncbi:MAG: sodium:solute symporter family protein [Thermoanaerobaculia bacterium]
MKLETIDFTILAAYFLLVIGVGLLFARRAKRSMVDYFISHRSMPWWLAGTAMVATTFSADTPLAVTEIVAKNGIAGNWLWWSMLPSGMLTVFFFARLWRRAAVVTDVEVTELRYSGRPAAFLRGFRAAYLGLVVNVIIMGWVNLGMAKVLAGTLGVPKWAALGVCLLITFGYTVVSGYWGVASTDGLQYVFEMGGAILLAVISVGAVGGIEAMKTKIIAAHPAGAAAGVTFGSAGDALSFFPHGSTAWALPVITFAALIGFNWWASWYPGAEPGGGGYVAQNMLACKDERNSRLAVLFFNVAHYAIRSWPWVITALCSLAIYGGAVHGAGGAEDPGANYVRMMVDLLPVGLRGLMLASFAAAYMSTQATQMNWGSSYLVNDLYRRFLRKNADEQHYVTASRYATLLTLLLSIVVTYFMDQVSHAWELLLMIGAGTGLVYILRWYWWRINAWSEVSAMAAALGFSLTLRGVGGHVSTLDTGTAVGFALNLILTTLGTTVVWLVVTLRTRPERESTLDSFYARVRPAGWGWGPVAARTGIAQGREEVWRNAWMWALGVVFVYSIMFSTGALIFHLQQKLWFWGSLLVLSGLLLGWSFAREPKIAEAAGTPDALAES